MHFFTYSEYWILDGEDIWKFFTLSLCRENIVLLDFCSVVFGFLLMQCLGIEFQCFIGTLIWVWTFFFKRMMFKCFLVSGILEMKNLFWRSGNFVLAETLLYAIKNISYFLQLICAFYFFFSFLFLNKFYGNYTFFFL